MTCNLKSRVFDAIFCLLLVPTYTLHTLTHTHTALGTHRKEGRQSYQLPFAGSELSNVVFLSYTSCAALPHSYRIPMWEVLGTES